MSYDELEREKRHVAACLDYYVKRAKELDIASPRLTSFVDLGERRPDGTTRTSYERWPNGAPT